VMKRPAFLERNADHLLASCSGSLGDRLRHFASLAVAKTDAALAVANHNQRSEAEALTALNRLRDAVNVDQLLDDAIIFFFALVAIATTATTTTTAFTVAAAPTSATFALLRLLGRSSFSGCCLGRRGFSGCSFRRRCCFRRWRFSRRSFGFRSFGVFLVSHH